MSTDSKRPNPQEAHLKPPFKNLKLQDSPGSEAIMDPKPDFGEETYKGLGRLKDKVAIVTGGDSGIGRAVCLAYAREGADVAVSYLNEHEDAAETKRVVEAAGRKCLLIPGDLTEESVCKKVIDETVSKLGKIDILVNNAAFQGKAEEDFAKLTHDRVKKTFNTNIVCMFDLVRFALPHFKEGASIINSASVQAYTPSDQILDYACTKGAIVAFTKGLSQSFIEKGIRVNAVAPGPVLTPLVVASFGEEKIRDFGKTCPMGRPAMPSELAPSYVFLATDESRFVTGEILAVTGGKITA